MGRSFKWMATPSSRTKADKIKFCAYSRRNRDLSALGYDSYHRYLQSDDWKRIRERKLCKFRRCLLCQKSTTQVHHLSYDKVTLLGLSDALLVALCAKCHTLIEFDGEEKRSLPEANETLIALANEIPQCAKWVKLVTRHLKNPKKFNKALAEKNFVEDDPRARPRCKECGKVTRQGGQLCYDCWQRAKELAIPAKRERRRLKKQRRKEAKKLAQTQATASLYQEKLEGVVTT